jgi:nicotinate-nucleotide adenylyltransferase
MNRLAVFGGTFNPIHTGHLMVAEEIRQLFGFDEVLFIPSALPPHKSSKGIISADQRLMMTTLATLDNPHFSVSSLEVERGGASYTVDTVKKLRLIYGEDTAVYFLIGSDAFLDISSWKDTTRLFELCRFVVIERPGVGLEELVERFKTGFFAQLGSVEYKLINMLNPADKISPVLEEANVYLIRALSVNVSSSGIRALIRRGDSIKYLVPRLVEAYILKNRLYQEDNH